MSRFKNPNSKPRATGLFGIQRRARYELYSYGNDRLLDYTVNKLIELTVAWLIEKGYAVICFSG